MGVEKMRQLIKPVIAAGVIGTFLTCGSMAQEMDLTKKETYDQIISDLETSIALLPNEVPLKTRPSKAAAEALLSRTYLHMAEYGKA